MASLTDGQKQQLSNIASVQSSMLSAEMSSHNAYSETFPKWKEAVDYLTKGDYVSFEDDLKTDVLSAHTHAMLSRASTATSTIGSVPEKSNDKAIENIMKVRDKLEDFLDGSNLLLKILNPQTIREMIREMRHEIRELKKVHEISEVDIIEYLEKEFDEETISKNKWRAETYEAENIMPF